MPFVPINPGALLCF